MKTRDIVIIIAVVVVVALSLGLGLGLGLKKGTGSGCCDLSKTDSCMDKCLTDATTCSNNAGSNSDKNDECGRQAMECSKKCLGCGCECFTGSIQERDGTEISAKCYEKAFNSDKGMKNCCYITDYKQYSSCGGSATRPSANC